ncbi:MAG: hypothetical protein QF553_01725 [Alphaproteobacteria bacterium]|jgi:hypothetical protein|nr:hypothetical protein [Alphaproteobacteria bacterium]MDP7190574.1 hypothetical protein [Alphaproteobacteria bacterium]HJO88286.1 hypothetical protein [Alphaproteobacteria bacterium]|tara:strand:+ start:282 stop:620 length:339 start_codon:yes stop_codon:yes gene_type:complete
MRKILVIFTLIGSLSIISACAKDGGFAEAEEEISIEKTLGTLIGIGLVVCAVDPNCVVPGAGNSSYSSFTGGPDWDWDIFPNGQYVCRSIQTGQFAEHHLCNGMPMDDDRWP